MRFSVLMPAYNVEAYICESIESILKQDFEDWELIIVDDGSTDKSGALADSYAKRDARIKVIHKPNKGLISARRVGIAHAIGEYCLFCDSDDFVSENWMSRINETIEQFHMPDMVIFAYWRYQEKSIENMPFPWDNFCEVPTKQAKELLLTTWYINSLWMKVFKRELLQKDPTNYSENYSAGYAEDILQSLYPLDVCQKIVALPEPLYYYRYNASSMMHKKIRLEKVKDYLYVDVQKIAYQYVKKWDVENLEDRFFALSCQKIGDAYKQMIGQAESIKEIKRINAYNWSDCMIPEAQERNYKLSLSKKTRILYKMAMKPSFIGACILHLLYRVRKK